MAVTRDEKLLAVGRENGQIEIYASRACGINMARDTSKFNSIGKADTWTMIHVIPGIRNNDIRNITWYEPDFCTLSKSTNNAFTYKDVSGDIVPRRLLTTGLNGAVIEWDLVNLQSRKIIDLGDTGIWDSCLHDSSMLLCACDDGAVRIICLESFTELKRLPIFDGKCLSVASSTTEKNTIYAAYSDGSIRKFLDGGDKKRLTKVFKHKEASIWTIEEVDGFLVSGDSNGEIIIWDKMNGNAIKTFKDFEGDVLTIAVNHDQRTIYASGVDSKVVAYKEVHISGKNAHKYNKIIGHDESNKVGLEKEWVYSGTTRGQSHDIKSLLYLENHQCLISGGVSTDLCIYSLEKYGKLQDSFKLKRSNKKFLHIPPFELKNQVTICTDLAPAEGSKKTSWEDEGIMIVVLRKTFSVELWMYEVRKKPVFLLEFEKSQFGITSVSVNSSASYICISDIETTHFYKINILEDEVNFQKISEGNAVGLQGVIYTKFMQNNQTVLTFNKEGEVNFVKIKEGDNLSVEVTNTYQTQQESDEDMYESDEEDKEYVSTLKSKFFTQITANENFISFGSFEQNQVFFFDFNTKEIFKAMGIDKTSLVTFTQLLTGNRLLVCYDTNKFLLHDLSDRNLSSFSRKNLKKFPINYIHQYNRIYACVELEPTKLMLYSHFTNIVIDLDKKIPEHSKVVRNHPSKTDQ